MMGWRGQVVGGIVGIVAVLASCGSEGMQGAYSQGMSLAQGIAKPSPSDPGIVPGYQGAQVPQTQLAEHDLDALNPASSQVRDNEAGRLLFETSQERERFIIDPHTDPIFMAANEVIANPEKAMSEEMVEEVVSGGSGEETHVCEESGEETLEEGEEFREVTVTQPPVAQHRVQLYNPPSPHFPLRGSLTCNVVTGSISLNGSPYPNTLQFLNPLPADLRSRVIRVERDNTFSCQGQTHYFSAPFSSSAIYAANRIEFVLKKYSTFTPDGVFSCNPRFLFFLMGLDWGQRYDLSVTFTIFYQAPITENDIKERIDSNCQYLEEKVDQGLCSYEDAIVTEGAQTRVIGGYPVTRDWWRRKTIYRCHYPCKDNCGPLRARGCWQTKSACKQKVGDVCVVWEQIYQCPSGQIGGRSWRSSSKDSPFCLSGDCTSKLYAPNTDFANVMAQLSVLKEAQEGVKGQLPVFRGEDKRCIRDCLGFRDCCGNGKGWGVSVKMASCGAEEKKLAKLREKGRCIQIGTYCAKKVLGQCISKKTTFCCYNSRLAKVIQEQGRQQLGLGRGDPEDPRCEGLSIDQLSRLDFSRINFGEAFGDVMTKTKVPQGQKMTQDIQKSMAERGSLMDVHSRPPTRQEQLVITHTVQGRGHGQF